MEFLITCKMMIKAFRKTTPVMFGYVPIGIAFGFLLVKAGYAWFLAVVMSMVIYSGATQFLAIGFFVNNASFPEIGVATILLNLRHTFFGISLIKKFSHTSYLKPYLIFALTDETYALLVSMEEPDREMKPRFYFFVSLFDHLYWIVGTLAGALLGHVITFDPKGLDFALTALFVVLTIEQYKSIRSFRPFLIALLAGISCLLLVPLPYFLLASILSGTTVLLVMRRLH